MLAHRFGKVFEFLPGTENLADTIAHAVGLNIKLIDMLRLTEGRKARGNQRHALFKEAGLILHKWDGTFPSHLRYDRCGRGDNVQESVDEQLGNMLDAIVKRIAEGSHMSEACAHETTCQLAFYGLLAAEGSPYHKDTEEANFRRMKSSMAHRTMLRLLASRYRARTLKVATDSALSEASRSKLVNLAIEETAIQQKHAAAQAAQRDKQAAKELSGADERHLHGKCGGRGGLWASGSR